MDSSIVAKPMTPTAARDIGGANRHGGSFSIPASLKRLSRLRSIVLPALLAIAALSTLPGCASRDAAHSASSADASDQPQYRFDDPHCSPEQRRAIRAATLAILGTDSPPQETIERLHYSVTRSANSWFIAVWQYDPGQTAPPGDFNGVLLDDDLTVKRIVGGS